MDMIYRMNTTSTIHSFITGILGLGLLLRRQARIL